MIGWVACLSQIERYTWIGYSGKSIKGSHLSFCSVVCIIPNMLMNGFSSKRKAINGDLDVFLASTSHLKTRLDFEQKLFLWSLITGRRELTMLFWSRGRNKICKYSAQYCLASMLTTPICSRCCLDCYISFQKTFSIWERKHAHPIRSRIRKFSSQESTQTLSDPSGHMSRCDCQRDSRIRGRHMDRIGSCCGSQRIRRPSGGARSPEQYLVNLECIWSFQSVIYPRSGLVTSIKMSVIGR